jgi:hypothetical protein
MTGMFVMGIMAALDGNMSETADVQFHWDSVVLHAAQNSAL